MGYSPCHDNICFSFATENFYQMTLFWSDRDVLRISCWTSWDLRKDSAGMPLSTTEGSPECRLGQQASRLESRCVHVQLSKRLLPRSCHIWVTITNRSLLANNITSSQEWLENYDYWANNTDAVTLCTIRQRSAESLSFLQVNHYWPVKPPSAMLNIKRGRSVGGFPLPFGASSFAALTSFPASFSPLTSSVIDKSCKDIVW